ncbi:pimeloyl-ACP methyl ester carboxylesterase [Stackebrandtia albiflava]|uniref:Pimeloyl-ACP methyl ester carboxylesterase n=1 Tax=Stackebrandtia albiflava TaxID=406432 RepID=A0A562VCI8_9ACTN|nr:alpha/beta fold hydrolase [Stackebrandtia albiflava]TWJ15590.1 pimeloyl-ACP methyl ester carboxylesterase [Stackebrandtia albiflava]
MSTAADPTVILLHAMGSSRRMWRAERAALADRFHVVTPDLPGHGGRTESFTLEAAVAEVCHLVGAATRPVVLAGSSLGATVALRAAVTVPERVAGLLLSGAMVSVPRLTLSLQRAVTRVLPLEWTAKASVNMIAPAEETDGFALLADIRSAGKRVQTAVLRELAAADLDAGVERVSAHTVVVCGERDRLNLRSARLLAERIPDARLVVLAGESHLWHMSRPGGFAELVRRVATASRSSGA